MFHVQEVNMASKLACIVYLSSYQGSVEAVEDHLQGLGYDVHSFEVTKARAEAVRAGDVASLPDELRKCLQDAELCVLLLGDEAECLGAIGGLGSDLGCRVVTMGGDPESLPAELDDVIDGHLPDVEQPQVDEVFQGTPERIKPDGTASPDRKPKRVKCQ
jgi:hypothetical protein